METKHGTTPDHPASQSDDGSFKGEEHSVLDGPQSDDNPHHREHRDPRTLKETLTDEQSTPATGFVGSADHSHVYHNMMRVGFKHGLPIASGIVMFIALLLLSQGFVTAIILAVLTYLGVLAFSKAFFVEAGAEGETH